MGLRFIPSDLSPTIAAGVTARDCDAEAAGRYVVVTEMLGRFVETLWFAIPWLSRTALVFPSAVVLIVMCRSRWAVLV
jgi:hypothetical protein